mmetsp:Transcript_44710/g.43315  ORF Transcript_44710/g.43315 Transcript_44710/m.43315 type:complete len:289 (-) Transcript_44710:8-874(-)
MADEGLPDVSLFNLPNPDVGVGGDGDAVDGVVGELAVPDPASMAGQVSVFEELVIFFTELPDLAGPVRAAGSQMIVVGGESALEDVVVAVGLELLLGGEVVPVGGGPDVAEPRRVPRHQLARVCRHRDGPDPNVLRVLEQVLHTIRSQIPNSDAAILIPKVDFHLVRMEHGIVHHDPSIVAVPHVPTRLEVKYFESAVFAAGEEPLVVLLEAQGGDVPGVPFIHIFAIMRKDVVDLDEVVGSDAEVLSVWSDDESVDLVVGEADGPPADAIVDVPELDRVVIAPGRHD